MPRCMRLLYIDSPSLYDARVTRSHAEMSAGWRRSSECTNRHIPAFPTNRAPTRPAPPHTPPCTSISHTTKQRTRRNRSWNRARALGRVQDESASTDQIGETTGICTLAGIYHRLIRVRRSVQRPRIRDAGRLSACSTLDAFSSSAGLPGPRWRHTWLCYI